MNHMKGIECFYHSNKLNKLSH